MKKKYVKPQIIIENFSLSETIAAGCEVKTNLPSANTCGLDFSGLSVFFDGMTGCSMITVSKNEGDGQWDKICYHVPTGENIFAS